MYKNHFMTTAELLKIGFSVQTLKAIKNEPGQNIAIRFGPDGTLFWNTEKLQKYIEENIVLD